MYQSRTFVRRLTTELTTLIIEDETNNVPFRHKTNTGQALIDRIKQDYEHDFPRPRTGDAKFVRSLYSSIRWLYRMHDLNL